MYLKGVCCEFCRHVRTDDCPVEAASPWSRWKDWCSEYAPNLEIAEARSIEEAVSADLKEQQRKREAWQEQVDRVMALERMPWVY
jgi:hypothetical protein